MDGRALERFWDKVDGDPDTGCWVWTASLNQDGYGQFWLEGTMRRAHVVSFLHFTGETIPEGHEPDHLCRNRACVFYQHLEVVTKRENILRGVGPTAQNAAATECKNGHPFTDETTRRNRRGSRVCIPCERAYMAGYYQQNRAAILGRSAERRRED
jgi:hypothetical protein